MAWKTENYVIAGAGIFAAALVAHGIGLFGGTPTILPIPATALTSDWSDDDLRKLLAVCDALGITDPSIPLSVWANESNNKTTAHNPNGDASGIFQLMPAEAKGLGWDLATDPNMARFRTLTPSEQLDWAHRYYAPHAGHINSLAAFYVANFLPVLLPHANDPSFILTGAEGPLAWAYGPNKSFDTTNKGFIAVHDLTDAASRAAQTPRSQELIARAQALKGVA